MFGLDDHIAALSHGGSILIVLLVATLLGLRHATDPDHLAAVTTLMASGRENARRRAAALGVWWGLGHALTLVVFGVPILLFEAYLPDLVQRGAETAVAALIVFLAVRLLVRAPPSATSTATRGPEPARGVRDRARPRDGRQRRRRRPPARGDPVDRARRDVARRCSRSSPPCR